MNKILLYIYKANPTIGNKNNCLPDEYARLMTNPMKAICKKYREENKKIFDLRDIVKEFYKKKKEIIEALICQKNRKLELFVPIDVNEKIINEFKKVNISK